MRSRGGRVAIGVTVALAMSGALALAALAASSSQRLTVTPAVGTPRTMFRLTFVAPEPTGAASGLDRSIVLTASRTGAGHGCVAQVERTATARRAGQVVHVALAARGEWCVGTFSGDVDETGRPICKATMACPQFIEVTPIGRLRFVVRRAATQH